jgi:hypothetical protein
MKYLNQSNQILILTNDKILTNNLILTIINIYILSMIFMCVYFVLMVKLGLGIRTFILAFIISYLIINTNLEYIIQKSLI